MPPPPQPVSACCSDGTLAGVSSALDCFTLWGLFPIYFNLLRHVPALEVLAHRIFGSAVLLLALLLARRQGSVLLSSFRNGRHLRFYLLTILLLSLIHI